MGRVRRDPHRSPGHIHVLSSRPLRPYPFPSRDRTPRPPADLVRVQVVVPSAVPRPHAMLAGGAKLQWDAGLAELRRRQHIHAICYQLRSVVSRGGATAIRMLSRGGARRQQHDRRHLPALPAIRGSPAPSSTPPQGTTSPHPLAVAASAVLSEPDQLPIDGHHPAPAASAGGCIPRHHGAGSMGQPGSQGAARMPEAQHAAA